MPAAPESPISDARPPVTAAPPSERVCATIDLAAIRRNFAVARKLSGVADCMAVVKADAYGHGLIPVARALAPEATFLGVAHVGEARRLVDAGIRCRPFLLGPTCPAERAEIVAHRWTPCLSSLDEGRHFDALARDAGCGPLAVHLAVDTGMGRCGFLPDEFPGAIEVLRSLPGLTIEGITSHHPSADEDETFTRQQIGMFQSVVGRLPAVRFLHLANSAGLLGYPQHPCNLIRPGLMLYGVSPLPAFQQMLTPSLTLTAAVTLVRELPAGHGVSYGRTFITGQPTTVATIGIGYGDGFPRHLSNRGADVLIGGRRCPVLGRVTMDQIMADVTDLPTPPEPGAPVVIIGRQESHEITAAELATKAGTIPWEIFTGLTARVSRHYV
ncbi:alanine racemase [soil metagenome]